MADPKNVSIETPKFPSTFWGVVGALVCWPFMVVAIALAFVACLVFAALAIVAVPAFAVAFVVLGIPVALVFKAVDRILG